MRKELQTDETSAKDGGQESNRTDDNGSHGQARDSQASCSALGMGRGAAAAASSGRARSGLSGGSRLGTAVLAARAGETRAFASTLSHVLLGRLGNGRQSIAVNVPVGRVLGGARVGTAGLVVVAVAGGVGGLLESGLQSIEIRELLDVVAANLHQTVVAGLLGVLVHETTRVDSSHVGGVEGGDFLEFTLVGVAAVFGQEERKTVASEVLDLLIPARDGERGGIAPGVVVESEKITALVIGTAVHILSHLKTVGVDIGLELDQ